MIKKIDNFVSLIDTSLRNAVKKMDTNGKGVVIVVDHKGKMKGILTDGDFRRAVLNGLDLDTPVNYVMTKNFKYVNKDYTYKKVKEIFLRNPIIKHIPVLDNGFFVDLILKEDFFGLKALRKEKENLNIDVVIMAGGEGKRLDPFTKIFPKALIPIENKPMIDYILEQFLPWGISKFYISLNYKSSIIKFYFHDTKNNINYEFLEESKPLGTAGGLKYLEGKVKKDFFVTNCDVIIKTDFKSTLKYHKESKNILTIIGSTKNFTIPYGICKVDKNGKLLEFEEKPNFDFIVNTGVYIVSPGALKYIPREEYFDMTDLVNVLLENNEKIGIFPISEFSWIDVGEWEKYQEAYNILKDKIRGE